MSAETRDSETAQDVFERILVGVDEGGAGLEALRQVAHLRAPGGSIHLVSVAEDGDLASIDAAEEALAAGRRLVPEATCAVLQGSPDSALLAQMVELDASVVAVGAHRGTRVEGILIGAVATFLLHEAPGAVLVARPPREASRVPRSIVVGVDGSPESSLACAAASALAQRLEGELRGVVSVRGKAVDVQAVRRVFERAEEDSARGPVEALVKASADADLLIVGSRGVHGLRALGSVSERVAHRASCSVLVVRPRV